MKMNKVQKKALIDGLLMSFLNKKLLKENEHTDASEALRNVANNVDNITLMSDVYN